MSSEWWRGKALDQDTHAAINAVHHPGTRQLCIRCDEPTGRCEEDEIYVGDRGPLCEACCDELTCETADADGRG